MLGAARGCVLLDLWKVSGGSVAFCCALTLVLCAACAQRKQSEASGNGNIARAEKIDQPLDPARLDAEIERLEQEAVANPGDDDVRVALSRAYLARANARRVAGRLQEALRDYSTALRYDPDNAEAQREAVAVMDQLHQGREAATGENNEPEPLPITPDVMADEASPTPQRTPKRKN
ncbi:MAG: hypothetical protein C4334_01975 [Pyrinomonas sp.]|uniref:tetratricopeptide repeat protein n=1 Tax=Pyrinomonas sp. TaxID=2080306 RepID=UPI003318CA21